MGKNETSDNTSLYGRISGLAPEPCEILVEAFSVQAINEETGGWSGEDNTDVSVADGSAALRALQAEFSTAGENDDDTWQATS